MSDPNQPDKPIIFYGALATLTSAASSPFMTGDYRVVGYILAGANILLAGLVATKHSMTTDRRKMKFFLPGILSISVGSVILLLLSYKHPNAEAKAQPVIAAQPARQLAAQPAPSTAPSYTITTTGKNSPVITGTSAPITIGDGPQAPAKEQKHK